MVVLGTAAWQGQSTFMNNIGILPMQSQWTIGNLPKTNTLLGKIKVQHLPLG